MTNSSGGADLLAMKSKCTSPIFRLCRPLTCHSTNPNWQLTARPTRSSSSRNHSKMEVNAQLSRALLELAYWDCGLLLKFHKRNLAYPNLGCGPKYAML